MNVEKYTAWVYLSPQLKADMGLPLTDEERAALDADEARLEAWRKEMRRPTVRFRGWLFGVRSRMAFAWDVLRHGHDCGLDDT
jgi:hypothetical protein